MGFLNAMYVNTHVQTQLCKVNGPLLEFAMGYCTLYIIAPLQASYQMNPLELFGV